jgi:hypothetical protein
MTMGECMWMVSIAVYPTKMDISEHEVMFTVGLGIWLTNPCTVRRA